MRDAPAGDRSRGRVHRVGTIARRSPQQQGGRCAALGRELQPPRLGQPHAPGLADDRAQAAMAEPFFQQRQQLRIVARFRIDHPGGGETCLKQAGREQVARAHHPEHIALRACGDSRHEQDRGGIVPPARSARGNFVQRIEPQPRVREPVIELGESERQNRPVAHVAGNDPQALAKLGNGRDRGGDWTRHSDSQPTMFAICS